MNIRCGGFFEMKATWQEMERTIRRSHRSGTLAVERRLERVAKLLLRLHEIWPVSSRQRIRCQVGLFVVSKKNEPCVLSWTPDRPAVSAVLPHKRTVMVLAGLDLCTHVLEAAGRDGLEGDLCGVLMDLYNGFSQTRQWRLESLFGIDFQLSAKEWRGLNRCSMRNSVASKLWNLVSSSLQPQTDFPKGFSWTLLLCNDTIAAAATAQAVFELDLDHRRHHRHRSTQCSCRMLAIST